MTAEEARELATAVNQEKEKSPSGFAQALRANIKSLAACGKFTVSGSLGGERAKDPVFQQLRDEGYVVRLVGTASYSVSWGDCAGG